MRRRPWRDKSENLHVPHRLRQLPPAALLLLRVAPALPGAPRGGRGAGGLRRRAGARVVGGEPVLEAHLLAAPLAPACVGERERLLAPRHGAPRLALPRRVAPPRPRVRLQHGGVVPAPVPGPPLDGVAAGLADDDGAALVRGARAAVVPVRPVLRAERLAAAVAVEGEEVELVAVLPVALRPQVRERLRAPPRHGKSIRRLVGCLDDSFLLLLESSETIALTSVVVVVAWIYRGRGSLPFPIPTRFAFLFRQEGWGAVWSGLE